MAAIIKPHHLAFIAGGTIVHGHAVKAGADDEHVVEATANTDNVLGIAQISQKLDGTRTAASGDVVEVAMPGGGAEVKLGEACVAGKLLVSHTDGTLVKANALGDQLIASVMEGGASGDLVSAVVIKGHAAQAE